MHEYTQQKEQEIFNIEAHIEQLKQDYEPYKAQDDLNLLYEVFPILGERLRIMRLCKAVGLAQTIYQWQKYYRLVQTEVSGGEAEYKTTHKTSDKDRN